MNRQQIHGVREFGQPGRPVLVMCSMIGWPKTVWFNLANQLSNRYHVITYDNVINDYDVSHYNGVWGYSRDLVELLGEMEIPSCVFVGHSLSCMVGAYASLMQPGLVSKLIMINPTPLYRNDNAQHYNGGFTSSAISQIINVLRNNHAAIQENQLHDLVGPEAIVSSSGQELCAPLFELPAWIAVFVASSIFNYADARNIAVRITVPCAILQSVEDQVVPRSVTEFLQGNIPGAVVEFLPTRHHSPHLRDYRVLAPVIHRHL